jgi:hypothetical protein
MLPVIPSNNRCGFAAGAAVATESVINRLEAKVLWAFLCGNVQIQSGHSSKPGVV